MIHVATAPINLDPILWLVVGIIILAILGLLVYFLWSTIAGWLSALWNWAGNLTTGGGLALAGYQSNQDPGSPDYVSPGQAQFNDLPNTWPTDF